MSDSLDHFRSAAQEARERAAERVAEALKTYHRQIPAYGRRFDHMATCAVNAADVPKLADAVDELVELVRDLIAALEAEHGRFVRWFMPEDLYEELFEDEQNAVRRWPDLYYRPPVLGAEDCAGSTT